MKVITPKEMAALEGEGGEAFMDIVGKKIANLIPQFVHTSQPIILICGKGNNAGDAFVVGTRLIERGYEVFAYSFFPEMSPLCVKKHRQFLQTGGKHSFTQDFPIPPQSIIIDGIVGTGFQGAMEGPFAEVIKRVNASGRPIFAIDIPSGLNGETGKMATIAINATMTFFLGLPKTGFFLEDGPKATGKLIYIDFGLNTEPAVPHFNYLTEEEVAPLLPPIVRTRHKYQKGFVIGLTGSENMPGAAYLSSLSALRGGAGLVKVLLPKGTQANLAPEIIRHYYEKGEDLRPLLEQASAVYIGPGLGKNFPLQPLLTFPAIIDADAIDAHYTYAPGSILTPHFGELARLLDREKQSKMLQDLLEACQAFVDQKKVILIVKGMPTWIFSPGEIPCISVRGDPGMATAGSGDVLTGVLAALLSQHVNPQETAMLGVMLHGIAGEIACAKETSYSTIASDIIEALPKSFRLLQDVYVSRDF